MLLFYHQAPLGIFKLSPKVIQGSFLSQAQIKFRGPKDLSIGCKLVTDMDHFDFYECFVPCNQSWRIQKSSCYGNCLVEEELIHNNLVSCGNISLQPFNSHWPFVAQ